LLNVNIISCVKKMGIHNSSLTRVRPFFRKLIEGDPTGLSWLPKLLCLAPNKGLFVGNDLLTNPGPLSSIDLDKERKLHPPAPFLRWLIEHPHCMTWPKRGKARFSEDVQKRREKLMGIGNSSRETAERPSKMREADQQEAIREALANLTIHGTAGSIQKWWAFEGRTSVDCFLATNRLRIYVEGKRKDILSPSTDWYPRRNQLMRNLESARDDAGGVPFACLVIAEQRLTTNLDTIDGGLPHLSQLERRDLFAHFLGSITWREAAAATGISYDDLPDEV
jgi:hypothetical protein